MKLGYGDGADKLPDPYFMQDSWQNDPESNVRRRYWQLAVTITPGMFSRASMKAYN